MSSIKPQTLKGFRDFLPEEARKRQYAITTLRKVFESYGFEPLETPSLEYEEILLGKYGEEGDKLMYRFEDNGKRKVALRYDQTVPLARVVAQYQNELPMPFKRYQIQNVWRAENTQKGRYREFLQCDIDTVGPLRQSDSEASSSSPLADAEIIEIATASLKELGFKNFKIYINFKSSLYKIMEQVEIEKSKRPNVARSLDKLDKIGKESVVKELIEEKGINKGCVDELFRTAELIKNNIPESKDIVSGNTLKIQFETLRGILQPFKKLNLNLRKLNIPSEIIVPKLTLTRGLDYYTGMIFEIEIEGYSAGSVCGGGRYDNLIGMFTNKQIPAVGCAFGFDRLIEAMEELKLFPKDLQTTKVLVIVFPASLAGGSEELKQKSIDCSLALRSAKVSTELYLDENTKLEKQLKYADKKGIPYAVIIGPEEAKNNTTTLRNMKTRVQENIPLNDLLQKLQI